MKAWYFGTADHKLTNGDGREIVIGSTHEVDGPVVLCQHGLHGSVRLIDALQYASGSVVYRVDIGGEIAKDNDKLCGTMRTYLAGGIDISDVLNDFARWCALSVIHLWDAPKIVVDYLTTGDETIRDAAWDAAWDAARDAAWAVARDAAWAAAWDAARDAARDAAGDAAWDAAWAVARAAAWDAARDAAGDAAGDAARDAQNRKLTHMVNKAIKEALT